MFKLVLIGVGIAAFLRRLLDNLCRKREVLHALGARCHTVENAESVCLVSDRNIGDFILESLAGGIEHVHPLLRQPLPFAFVGS